MHTVHVRSIGSVEISEEDAVLKVDPAFLQGLKGLDGFSHIWVLYWCHENDNPDSRSILQVHPRRDPDNPLTGVFGTRSPARPNPLALSLCRIKTVNRETGEVRIFSIDARNGSPLVDLKPYLPHSDRVEDSRVPAWVKKP